jgi:D-amino-acid oxidase
MSDVRLPTAVVVGSGVSGLTTGVILAENGWAVTVVAELPWSETTSRIAGAVWAPYLSEGPDVNRWATTTYDVLAELSDGLTPGVRLTELLSGGPDPGPPPTWARITRGFRPLRHEELRGDWAAGFRFLSPLLDMGTYLPYLLDRFEASGGRFEQARVERLADLGPADVVVNCAGLGAIELAADDTMRPVRGQIVVTSNPGVAGAIVGASEGTTSTYRFAHLDHVILGGTADMDAWDLTVDADVANGIVNRVLAVDPAMNGAEVLDHRVGLRPWRPTVRVERDPEPPEGVGRLIHNYGHGGGGVTLSWGCARHAVRLAQAD